MKITKAELERVNDWRHANHVASLSEAIRRLVAIGLQTEQVRF